MHFDSIVPFYNLDTQAQGEINRITRQLLVKKGDTLFGGDELLRYFYIVVSGKIKSYQLNFDNGKEQTIFVFREGDMFDTIVLLDGKPHDVMYEALEDSELLQLSIEEVRHLLQTSLSTGCSFLILHSRCATWKSLLPTCHSIRHLSVSLNCFCKILIPITA